MPGIAARPGSRALAVRFTPARPTPVRPRRSCSAVTRERPTRATRRSLRSPCGRRERRTGRCPSPTSATDPQHEHPLNRWTPRLLRLAAPSARVEIRLTPSSSFGRPPDACRPAGRQGAPVSGPALRRGRPVRPPASLGARPLTLPVTARTAPRKAGPPGQPRAASAPPSSKGAASTTRSAFHRQVPPVACSRERAGCGEIPSTSAITTVPEHDREQPETPRGSPVVAHRRDACLRAAPRLPARSGSSNPGPGAGGGLSARQRPSGDPSPKSFAPDPTCPDTSCHAPAPTPAGVARRRTAGTPASDAGAPPAPGLLSPPPREEGRRRLTRGAFHREETRRMPPGFPQVVTSLWIPGAAPLLSPEDPAH